MVQTGFGRDVDARAGGWTEGTANEAQEPESHQEADENAGARQDAASTIFACVPDGS